MKAKIVNQLSKKRKDLHKAIPLNTPWVIYIEPSGFCNLRCSFCPQTTKKMKKDMMGLELFKHCINQIKAFPKPIKMLRVCGNGEPLTNPNIIEMLQFANQSKKFEKIELVTNGTLLTDELTRQLPLYCNRIIISIEGLSDEDYEAMTCKRINFNKLVENIYKLYKNKRNCKIMVKTVNEAVKIKEKQEKFYKIFSNICDEIYIENLIPMWPGMDSNYATKSRWKNEKVLERKVCVQIFKGVQIQADGDVVPCCVDWERINLLGNLKETTIKDIWLHSVILSRMQARHLRGDKSTILPCKNCVMNDTCDPDNIDKERKEILRRLQ